MNASVQARRGGLTTDRLSYRQFGTADFGVPQHDSSKKTCPRDRAERYLWLSAFSLTAGKRLSL